MENKSERQTVATKYILRKISQLSGQKGLPNLAQSPSNQLAMSLDTPQKNFTMEKTAPMNTCLLYTSPSPRDGLLSRMPSSA